MRFAALLLALAAACRSAGPPAPEAVGGGAVAAPDPLSAEVGVEVLRAGGNAVDAAVAVGFALAVTFPEAGNLGGGGFMLVRHGASETAVDYRERAPASATADMYLDAGGSVHPTRSRVGVLAAGVPGSVHGLWTAHQEWGTRPWAELVAPAIRLAEEGWVLDEARAARLAEHFKTAAGERFRQPELGQTLRRIAASGPAGFYGGPTAGMIEAQMKRDGGLITREDLRAYRAVLRRPLSARVGDLRIVSMPPPSSGGIALIQLLKLASLVELPEAGSPLYLHRIAEIEKRVFADRSHWLGDPDHVKVPVAGLMADAYLSRRAEEIGLEARSDPGKVGPVWVESEQTTHYSIVDRWGGAAAVTTTLNDSFGCGVVVEGAGFLLNNEMDDFSAKPGAPNLYGVTGGAANAIAPGKRMLSSMTPTLVFRNDRLWLVLGTPGGPTIFTSVFQVILNRRRHGRTLEGAVAAGRFHHQWPPQGGADVIWVERGREPPAATLEALHKMGYSVQRRGALGDIQAIELGPAGPIPVSDPRGLGRGLRESLNGERR